MKTLLTIYLTALHIYAAATFFLYTNDKYVLTRIESGQQAECCDRDELTAYLTAHERKKGK